MLSMLTFARLMAVLVAGFMAINAAFMVVSPRAWFRLPAWLRANGIMSEDKYGSGVGALQVRAIGALILFLIAGVSYDILEEFLSSQVR